MKTAEIVTVHNVVIQYELATSLSRVLASLIDAVVVFFYFFGIALLSSLTFGGIAHQNETLVFVMYVLFIPGLFYSFFMEALFGGRTLGKMAMGTKVINVNGSKPSLGDYFLRWIFRMIDIIASLGSLALVVSLGNERGQRLGDVVANTMLIKLRSSKSFSIFDILNIKNKENYEPAYPEVVQLNDDDLLLIKNSISRFEKTPNEAHQNLINELFDKTIETLHISADPTKKISFLKKLLQDYIVLTRS